MKAVWLIVALAGFGGRAFAAERFEFEEPHMGTKIRVVLYAADKDTAQAAAKAAFRKFADLEAVMSDYRNESEAMKLCTANDAAPGVPQDVSEDLAKVLAAALDVSKKSEGAFDVTVGPLSKLWRETRKAKKLPEQAVLEAALAKVGWEKLTLDGRKLTMAQAGMRLDFGGIGKGYAAEEALAVLKKLGIESALVAASGDISVSDAPPGREGWTVDIAPLDPKDPPRRLLLKNAAVSTSGDLFQHVEIDGVRYSHVLNPKTGLGLIGFRSATVIHKRGTYADALSKAASILPPETAIKVIEAFSGETFIATKEATSQSAKFESYLIKEK